MKSNQLIELDMQRTNKQIGYKNVKLALTFKLSHESYMLYNMIEQLCHNNILSLYDIIIIFT